MFTPYRSLTSLLVTAGEVRGRKKLQKMVFIAQSLGHPFTERYDLHVWGPYSEMLAMKLQEMKDWGFASETVLPGPAGNHHYIYTAGPNAERALSGYEADESFASLTAHLNQQDATFLEGVATVLFLRAQGKSDEEITQMLPRLKPDKFSDPAKVQAVRAFASELDSFRLH